ncbi:hypothetical protein Cgig2_018210 [Carnegiea gigantea]|uniref:RRM domain-containing protein n=1 Tax=Carnegiea gigantea TaxID=171969 RepID=A0A9Q1QS33_9CARY|nr:hypothetical protein Cgig2_018210 [Carnegiea gigantea]
MGENGVVRFAGNLDPGAQEFRPAYPTHHHHQQQHHVSFFYPTGQPEVIYSPPLPPPPPATILPPPARAPTRAVLLSSVPSEVSESEVRRELEVFGDVRAVEMERVREGIVTVHFYDLRAAHAAIDAVRYQHMQHQQRLRLHFSSSAFLAPNNHYPSSFGPPIGLGLSGPPPLPPPAPGVIAGRAVWAQFTIPATNTFPDGTNQGTIVIFNLDPDISTSTLRNIFQAFGTVKELRETPMKKQQRFVEFFDVRDASRALTQMNGKEISGRKVLIEYSRPGGNCYKNKHHHHFPTDPRPPPLPPPPLPLRNHRVSPRHRARRRLSPRSEESSMERAVSGLRSDEEVQEEREKGERGRKHSDGDSCSSSGGGTMEGRKGGKSLKGKQKKKFDPKFMIKEGAIMEGFGGSRDTRTTLMIKNIPNKYSQKLLLNMLDNHCIHCNEQITSAAGENQPFSSYDFLYLPIDFNNKCNVGYGFVNMTSPEATLRLYKAFHHQHWEVFNSRKICEVTYARVQGLEALKEHFKNSKFGCQNDEYLPVVFSPPRDGRQLAAPIPIVFPTQPTQLPPSTPSHTVNHDQNIPPHDHDLDGCDDEEGHHISLITSGSEGGADYHDDVDHHDDVDKSSAGSLY